MAWSRFEPGFSRHPKRIKVGPLASWLWVCSVDHCTEFRTNGFLDLAAIPSLSAEIRGATLRKCIDALMEVRSWIEAPGGYIVHGYLDHNPSSDQVEADRKAARERYQRWKDKRGSNAVDERVSNGVVATPTVSRSVSRSVGQDPSVGSPGNLEPPAGTETEKRWGLLPNGQYRLHDGMFNTGCEDARRWPPGTCVKTEWLRDVPHPKQCPRHVA